MALEELRGGDESARDAVGIGAGAVHEYAGRSRANFAGLFGRYDETTGETVLDQIPRDC